MRKRKRGRIRNAVVAVVDFLCNIVYSGFRLLFKLLEAIFD